MAHDSLSRWLDRSLREYRYYFKRDWLKAGPAIKRAFLCAIVALVSSYAYCTIAGQNFERTMLRQWFSLRGPRPVPDSVTIVRLDEPAYAAIGKLPGERFPRRHIADGLNTITAAGARLIVLDLFPRRPGDDAEADELLAEALSKSPSVIGRYTERLMNVDQSGIKREKRFINKPLGIFAESAKAVIPMQLRRNRGVVEEICLSNDVVLRDVRVPLLEPLRLFVSEQVAEPGGWDFINFYGGPGSLTSLSFAELMGRDAAVPEGYFKDRVVFIGVMTDAGVGIAAGKDTFITSASTTPTYGVEIQATIAANLLDRSWIRRWPPHLEVGFCAVLAFVITYWSLLFGSFCGSLIALGACAGWLGASYYAFSRLFCFIPGATVCLVLVVALWVVRWGIEGLISSRAASMLMRWTKDAKKPGS